MLTQKKKILLGTFLAMFAVPEVLWSPVFNWVYSLVQNSGNAQAIRPNTLIDASDQTPVLFVLLVQLIGLIGVLVLIFQSQINIWLKSFLLLVLTSLALVTGFVLFLAFGTRHGIGF